MKDIPALLEKNLEIMSKYQPKLAQRLRQELDSMDEFPAVDIQETASGRWVKVGDDAPFFDKAPVLPKKRKSEEDSYCFIIKGVGYPPYLFQVLRGISKDALAIIVLEPDLNLLLLTLSMTSVYHALPKLARLTFICIKDRELIDESHGFNVVPIGIFPLHDALEIIHPGLIEKDYEKYTKLYKSAWEEIRYYAEQLGNSPEDTLIGLRHGALNTPWILSGPTFEDLRVTLGGRPAICVASGPSLKNNVEQLKGMEDLCLIISCDSSLISLLRRGIRPHVVVTIERNLMYDVWLPGVLEEFYEECCDILLVSQSVSEPQTAGRWPGPVFVVGKIDSPADRWIVSEILGMNLLLSGMCVAHMAMNFALAMGATAVALIGQDLAFAEDGETTHIEDASSATPDGIARERSYVKREVPGVKGGTVKTHQMWFYFLQMFERFLAGVEGVKVYQCSEAGAAISGAEAISLDQFFKENLVIDSLPTRLESLGKLKKLKYSSLLDFTYIEFSLNKAFKEIDFFEMLLDEMEEEVWRATSPALLPERRRFHALKAAELLDQLHTSHRALAFIGQSYTHLAGASLAKNRFLDTVERVKKWKDENEGIIASHRVNLKFLRQWLSYIKIMCQKTTWSRLQEYTLCDENSCWKHIGVLLGEFWVTNETDPLSESAVLLSYLLCRVDPLRQKEANPDVLWNLARYFHLHGRAFEACRIMEKTYGILQGSEFPSHMIAQFFLDWAQMESAYDLIRMPRFDWALILLQNIPELAPHMIDAVDYEKSKLLMAQRGFWEGARKYLSFHNIAVWDYRSRAQEALTAQNLPEAFEWIQKMIAHCWDSDQAVVLPNLLWLMKTALECRGAVSSEINAACESALSSLFDIWPRLSSIGVVWPKGWSDYLRERGYTGTLLPSDAPVAETLEGGAKIGKY